MKAIKSEHDERVEALGQLIARLRYLDVLDERHGVNWGRQAERSALTFVLDDYEERHPDAMKAAHAQAEFVRERKRQAQALRDANERRARS